MALNTFTNKIRPPVMKVFLLKQDTPGTHKIDIDALIADSELGSPVGITVGATSGVTHLYDLDVDAAFTTSDGYGFNNKRLKSVTLPKEGIPTQKDPYLGYDSEGFQQHDTIQSEDADTNISFEVKLDGSEPEFIYPKASDSATAGYFGDIARRAGLRVGQSILKVDILVQIDGSIGNTSGKKIAHYFQDVSLQFTPEQGSADNKADIMGTYEGMGEKYWIEKEQ